MQSLISFFGGNNSFIPHGICLNWNPALLWLNVISDTLIALSYYSLPISILYFLKKRGKIPYAWFLTMVALFIVSCGTNHLMHVVLVWIPLYWLDGYLKALTAIISVATAVAALWVIPFVLKLPAIEKLQSTISECDETYHSLLAAIQDGFFVTDMQGKILDVNDSYANMSGYSLAELLNMNISDFNYRENIIDALTAKKIFFETEQRCKDNSFFDIEISIFSNKTKAFVFVYDISKRKEVERELAFQTAGKTAALLENAILNATNIEKDKRSEELKLSYEKNISLNQQVNHMQKLESIGRMTSGIAHDFNNILACMLGYNEMNQYISDEMQNETLRNELRNNSKQIDSAGQRAVSLIKKMMLYCRHDDMIKISNTQFSQEAIIDVLEMLRPALTSRIQVDFHHCDITNGECSICLKQKNCDTRIQIESIDLHQILTNLAINSRDAMKERGGVITFSVTKVINVNTHCVACVAPIEGDFVELCVSDNGSGIDPQIIGRLFDPFFTTKPQGEGTGLGLSAVSGLVHKAGGHILINSNQSELNHGTTFRLLFPPVSN